MQLTLLWYHQKGYTFQETLKSKKYYEKAIELDADSIEYALNNLGELYFEGLGVKADFLKAKTFNEKA